MAQMIFNIPDEQVQRVLDGLCVRFGYTPEDGPKAAFVHARLSQLIRRLVKAGEQELARQAVRDSADPEVT